MIGVDMDGTLLPYRTEENRHRLEINQPVADALAARGESVAILTIQGGLNFAGQQRKDGGGYPTVAEFMRRLEYVVKFLHNAGVAVDEIRVCVFHPRADANVMEGVAADLRRALFAGTVFSGAGCTVYTTKAARKPEPLMLREAGVTEYWGDSPEDYYAARNACVPYGYVPRFIGAGKKFDWSTTKFASEGERLAFGVLLPAADKLQAGGLLCSDRVLLNHILKRCYESDAAQ